MSTGGASGFMMTQRDTGGAKRENHMSGDMKWGQDGERHTLLLEKSPPAG